MACSMSSASSPRTSPTTMRSGRIRRLLTSSSRWRTAPLPSRLAGRVSRRTTCGCFSCSSAASSMVTMRSLALMNAESAFSSVVLPAPVPPAMMMFSLALTAASSSSIMPGVSALRSTRSGGISLSVRETADGKQRAVHRQRRNDGVDARAVAQARVHHGRRFVDAAAHLADDLVDDAQQVLVVAEA